MRRARWVVPLVVLSCGADEESWSDGAVWLQGFGYEWLGFNHRVSYVSSRLQDSGGTLAVVGGTSTTAAETVLDDGCEVSTCGELPFLDYSTVDVRWGRVSEAEARFVTETATLQASAGGGTVEVEFALPRVLEGELVPLIQGFTIDTDTPLASGEESCYQPRNGWLPTQMGLALSEATVSGDGLSASVSVQATFAAGLTHETLRECIDAVAADAAAEITVDVLLVVGATDRVTQSVNYAQEYEFDGNVATPPEQLPPDEGERTLDVPMTDRMLGWRAFDFQFHTTMDDGAGAYLRSWSVDANPSTGVVSGHSTNYSPFTQLTGFDYVFEGTVEIIDVGGQVETGEYAIDALEPLPAELDEEGRPVVYEWSY